MNAIEFLDIVFPIILKCLFTVITAAIIYIGIPWLKEAKLYSTIGKFVLAAEKMADTGAISKDMKKQYVLRMLTSMGVKVTERVSTYIEAAVEELDLAKDEIITAFEDDFDDGK